MKEYLKYSFSVVPDIYVELVNLIFYGGIVPDEWLLGNIIPIYKNKGDQLDPKNLDPSRSLVVLEN